MRSAVAKRNGLDEDLVAELDDVPSSDVLTEAQQVAIELADQLMTHPGRVPADLADRLQRHFTRDLMKWNYQKIPVALATDHEVVPGELADLVFDGDGHWVRPG